MRVATAILLATLCGLRAHANADVPVEVELRTSGPIDIEVGRRGSASLTLVPAPGKSLFHAAPVTVSVKVAPQDQAPKDGIRLLRERFSGKDAADPRADALRFAFLFDAVRPGRYELVLRARFWVCGRHTCRPVDDTASLAITVSEKAPPP